MEMIEQWIASYKPSTVEDFVNAKREILQELALSGLNRAGFFSQACFYGGSALRIFYGLNRYSEDLDFSLLKVDPAFSLQPYLESLKEEFALLGLDAEITVKQKGVFTSIESAFLKDNTEWSTLSINAGLKNTIFPKLKIKLEVDREPPLDFNTEPKLLLKPFTQYISCMVKEDLFAGKMHALLFRQWVNNVKGRDWYDLVWYITNGIAINLDHFNARARASNNLINDSPYEKESLLVALHAKIDLLNIEMASKDIRRFISNHKEIEIWSTKFFHDLIEKLQFESGGH